MYVRAHALPLHRNDASPAVTRHPKRHQATQSRAASGKAHKPLRSSRAPTRGRSNQPKPPQPKNRQRAYVLDESSRVPSSVGRGDKAARKVWTEVSRARPAPSPEHSAVTARADSGRSVTRLSRSPDRCDPLSSNQTVVVDIAEENDSSAIGGPYADPAIPRRPTPPALDARGSVRGPSTIPPPFASARFRPPGVENDLRARLSTVRGAGRNFLNYPALSPALSAAGWPRPSWPGLRCFGRWRPSWGRL